MTNSTQLQTIQFHNQSLITFEQNGTHYTAMKPICENIGLDWKSQYARIKRDDVLNSTVVIITIVANDGKERQMLCLPIQYLNGWLFGIDVKRVKPEIRETLITYKKECYQALFDYWNKGVAVKSAVEIEKLSKDHQTFIKNLVMDRTKRLPKEHQAKAAITQWSALKTHFGKSYKDINDDQFVEAVSLIARLPLEGELIEPKKNGLYSFEFTEYELQELAWLWFAFKRGIGTFQHIHKAFKMLGSNMSGQIYGQAYEYLSVLRSSNAILQRITKDIHFDEDSNWRVLKHLRQFNPKAREQTF
ncbi:phage antirepressor N-terminal domain-containing protein [Rodentibacter haemolyticus]|uniref:Antirepressor n=1 Tax=Rodentibacter haemolyticus TaxID=2778911 RepID=A0ABX6UVU8_9PAST|nr:phage antirepressor N-terminal domain-containing protein [Rodentibacter haemolyticus]QPB42207.1 hypothetical protein IHV77_09875 [Rodentibacter haemolyticus]